MKSTQRLEHMLEPLRQKTNKLVRVVLVFGMAAHGGRIPNSCKDFRFATKSLRTMVYPKYLFAAEQEGILKNLDLHSERFMQDSYSLLSSLHILPQHRPVFVGWSISTNALRSRRPIRSHIKHNGQKRVFNGPMPRDIGKKWKMLNSGYGLILRRVCMLSQLFTVVWHTRNVTQSGVRLLDWLNSA